MNPAEGIPEPTRRGSILRRAIHQLTRPPAGFILLSVLTALAYSNTFSVPFLFDDPFNISDNPWIKDPRNLRDFSGSRYIGFLTFALNYHFGGLNVFGYHLVNLLIHLGNALLVFALVRLLCRAVSPDRPDPKADGLALAAAALFALHPIQTQAVTYIVQRIASLAALFYLLTAVCYLKWRLPPSAAAHSRFPARHLWYALALISTLLAMKTKETTFTLPFLLLLIEAAFFSRKRWVALLPFLLTLPIIPLSRPGDAGLARVTTEISRGDYLLTQFRVILTYLRLLVFPVGQNLDYDYPVYHSLFNPPVLLSFLFLCALFGLSIYLLFFSRLTSHVLRLTGFGLLWFFITLSVESSVIPIQDVIFEHRLYLPSVGFFLALVAAVREGAGRLRLGRAAVAVTLVVVGSLGWATYDRNKIWRDDLMFWSDVVAKSPGKARPHNNLGMAYKRLGRLKEAADQFQTAIKIDPRRFGAYNNLGLLDMEAGRMDDAIRNFKTAIEIQPAFPEAHNNLALALEARGEYEKAERELRSAIAASPQYADAHNNLGIVLNDLGRRDEAVREFRTAIALSPENAQSHNNLGQVLIEGGKWREAMSELEIALRLDPNFAEAYNNLGNIYLQIRRPEDAARSFEAARRLKPGPAVAYNLGLAYQQSGRIAEARGAFEEALRIKPAYRKAEQALRNLPP